MRVLAIFHLLCASRSVAAEFVWGTATAAYQVEGYRTSDERQLSIWDAFDTVNKSAVIRASKPSGAWNVQGQQSGDRADEDYVRYPESAKITKQLGFQSVRMSVSWPRVMTYSKDESSGKLHWVRNENGIAHYKSVLERYVASNVSVALTMFHWDMPLLIEEHAHAIGCSSAWLCHEWIGDTFEEYAGLLLLEFKDYVSWWITINEPLTVVAQGYATGVHAPGRCSDRRSCWEGNSRTEPYAAAKGLILAHAHAFRKWESLGKPGKGCGITLNADFKIPFTSSQGDRAAATRALEWEGPLFADPIHFGSWPLSVQQAAGSRLPVWTEAEKAFVKGTHDGNYFMNSYTTNFVRELRPAHWTRQQEACGFLCDSFAESSGYNFSDHTPIGTPSSNGWLFNYGPGLGELVAWYNRRYPGLHYIITENGWGGAVPNEAAGMHDLERCNFYRDYLGNLSAIAQRDNIAVDSYYAWSLMDNYEWADGYTVRFGLVYVDYETQVRTPKLSALWFKKHITKLSALPVDGRPLPPCDDPQLVEMMQAQAAGDVRAYV